MSEQARWAANREPGATATGEALVVISSAGTVVNTAVSVGDNGAAGGQFQEYTDDDTATVNACADGDSDGICDADDNCPTTSNSDQSDSDSDGVVDFDATLAAPALAALGETPRPWLDHPQDIGDQQQQTYAKRILQRLDRPSASSGEGRRPSSMHGWEPKAFPNRDGGRRPTPTPRTTPQRWRVGTTLRKFLPGPRLRRCQPAGQGPRAPCDRHAWRPRSPPLLEAS